MTLFSWASNLIITAFNACTGWLSTMLSAVGWSLAGLVGLIVVCLFLTRFVSAVVGVGISPAASDAAGKSKNQSKSSSNKGGKKK